MDYKEIYESWLNNPYFDEETKDELRSIADRIGIVSDGKLACILKPDASDADFGLAMSGAWKGGENNEKSV